MSAVGGSIESVTLGGRTFAVTADAESQRKLGGDENEPEANGDGTARIIKTKTLWSIDGLVISTDDGNGDQEFLQGLADGNDFFPIVITYASNISYQGTGVISGEMQTSSQNATTSVSLMGTGILTKQ